jgi:hypothetical protein
MEFHRILLLLIPSLYFLLPLLINSWQQIDPPWFIPYLVWFFIIIFAFLIERRKRDV